VLVLAVGVGGSTAVFSVLRSVVLRPLELPHPEELVRLYERPAGTEARWPFSGLYLAALQPAGGMRRRSRARRRLRPRAARRSAALVLERPRLVGF